MDGLVLGAGSGIARALLRETWRRDGEGRWVLASRSGQPQEGLDPPTGIETDWRQADALEDPGAFLAGLGAWRPSRVLLAWGQLVPGGKGTREQLDRMREVNGAASLRWLRSLADWLEIAPGARVAVLGSVAGDRPRASMWDYSLSKQELEQGLAEIRARAAWARWTLVKPGPIATPMTAHMRRGLLLAEPAAIAPRVVDAWEGGEHEVYAPGYWGWISAILRRVPEPLFRRLPI